MLTVCCWKWDVGLHPKKRMRFGADHVNRLVSMLRRHLHMDYQIVCITDDAVGIDSSVRIVPLWQDHLLLGGCFVRLKMFAPEMKTLLGDRLCSIDLDTVILEDITPILDCKDEFKIWGETNRRTPYCGSLWVMDAGARAQVWKKFDPAMYPPDDERGNRKRGTDQHVISDILYPHEPMWTKADGIYNFDIDIKIDPALDQLRSQRAQLQSSRNNELDNAMVAEERYELSRIQRSTHALTENEVATRLRDAKSIIKKKIIVKYRELYKKLSKKIRRLEGTDERDGRPPKGCRLVFFNGAHDPNNPILQQEYPWIAENYK